MDDWEDFPSMPFRDRSNTWPRRVEIRSQGSPPPTVPDIIEEPSEIQTVNILPAPRNKTRRNVWGNKSYAELITEAILSTEEKRITLSQIYNWMVKNVDCFSDKHADNSSAGWKNSIRHNLSLHDCFMKLPNEQAGKSHWWVLNPNAKSSKMHRRRLSAHHNPIMDVDQPDEPFRRRSKSDCSNYSRPSLPSSNRYSPNCGENFYMSELEKEEANKILDSLIEAMKLEGEAKLCSLSGEGPYCNTEMNEKETNVLVSSVTEALKIEREDNKYLEAVEPISASPPKFSDLNLVSSSVTGYSANAMSPYPDISFKSSQNQFSANSGDSYSSSIYSSSCDSQQKTTQSISFLTACKSTGQQSFPPMNVDSRKKGEMFQASRKQNRFEKKEPNGAYNWSVNTSLDFTSVLRLPTLKQRENEDSIGRPRSKSYSGVIPKREITDKRHYEVNATPIPNSFDLDLEELIRADYGELSLQDIEPWPVIDDWQSSTVLSSALNF